MSSGRAIPGLGLCATLALGITLTLGAYHPLAAQEAQEKPLSFFITSSGPGNGAESVEHLHSDDNRLSRETSLTEAGQPVNGRGDEPNIHDILTGSNLGGTAYVAAGYDNCGNWTSRSGEGSTRVGLHDRVGGGEHPTSWNSAHGSRGCGQEDLRATGGNGLFYCFAGE